MKGFNVFILVVVERLPYYIQCRYALHAKTVGMETKTRERSSLYPQRRRSVVTFAVCLVRVVLDLLVCLFDWLDGLTMDVVELEQRLILFVYLF